MGCLAAPTHYSGKYPVDIGITRLSPESSRHTFSHLGIRSTRYKAFAGNEFGQNPHGCGPNSGWATPYAIFEARRHGLAADLATGRATRDINIT